MAVTVQPFDLTTGKRTRPLNWASIQLVPTFGAVGSWQLVAPATPDVRALAVFDADGTLVPFGIWVDWDGVWEGTAKAEECTIDRAVGDNGEITETITFSGPDMLSMLAERIAYPAPDLPWSEQAVDSVLLTGPAETVIKQLVGQNCVSAGDSARNYPLLTVAPDLGRGGACTWSITTPDPADTTDTITVTVNNSLMDIWRAITAQSATPLGIRVDLIGTQLVLDCYEPADLSAVAVFSARLGNLADASLDVINPSANAILMQSGLTSGAFTETPGAGAGPWRRIEQFTDESSATDTAGIAQAQASALTAGEAQTTLGATAVSLPRLRFGSGDPDAGITGYELGDRVAVDLWDGLTYTDVISSVTLSADATQQLYTQTVVPSVGTTGDDTSIAAALQAQLDRLETQIRRG